MMANLHKPALGSCALGLADPASYADGAAFGGLLFGIGSRAVMGYFVGKYAGASKGWTAAGAGLLGTLGVLASVGLTRKRVTPNRRRRSKRGGR